MEKREDRKTKTRVFKLISLNKKEKETTKKSKGKLCLSTRASARPNKLKGLI